MTVRAAETASMRGHHDEGAECLCVSEHRPGVLEYEHHHIWPQEFGGPSVAENMVWICPTTHTNVHELLRYFLKYGLLSYGGAQAVWDRPVNRYAYDLAVEGYHRVKAQRIDWRNAA